MKKNCLAILLFGLLTGIYSCDYISNPLPPPNPDPDPNVEVCETKPFPTTKPFRKVLVEDYTGHKCSNCPQAAVSAKELEETFHDSVIVIGVHSGSFAKPVTGIYSRNFKTEAGEEYIAKYTILDFPNGMVNRKDYPAKVRKPHTSWRTEVNGLLRTPVEADIKMLADYNTSDSTVCVAIQTTFLTAPATDKTYKIVLMLVQDSIIAPQLNGSDDQLDYVHRHVLRANINGTWGEDLLSNENPTINVPVLNKYRFKLKRDYGYEGKLTPKGDRIPCKRENCYLVAFVYEAGAVPTYRILQAEEVKIIK